MGKSPLNGYGPEKKQHLQFWGTELFEHKVNTEEPGPRDGKREQLSLDDMI